MEHFGTAIETGDQDLTRIFPEPEAVAKADLAKAGLPDQCRRPIRELADMARADRDRFRSAKSLDDLISRLSLPSDTAGDIADYVAMRAFGEPDAYPVKVLGLVGGGPGNPTVPGQSSILSSSENWRPWRAYGAMHVWCVLHGC